MAAAEKHGDQGEDRVDDRDDLPRLRPEHLKGEEAEQNARARQREPKISMRTTAKADCMAVSSTSAR